ncbi:hypothetical protein PUN28_016265 [Cardiocondyla obscurior]|uniref:Uncharacterized protein n=1 Tax=Cardiocondyla obscurior TaxID=286306 RepID=A0AAW2ERP2_9HYME
MTPRASVSQSALQKEDSQPIPAPQQQPQQNGNIVPAGPSEVKEMGEQHEPSANDLQQKQQKDVVERPNIIDEEKNNLEEEQRKQKLYSCIYTCNLFDQSFIFFSFCYRK